MCSCCVCRNRTTGLHPGVTNTVTKIKQVLARVLVENQYLDQVAADHLNPVLIAPILERSIRSSGDLRALAAFKLF